MQQGFSIPQVDEHLVAEVQQEPDQNDVVDYHDDLAHEPVGQQPNRESRNQRKYNDRRDHRARVMHEQLNRIDVDPLLDTETVERSGFAERERVFLLTATTITSPAMNRRA